MNVSYFKRRYADSRVGYALLAPLLAFSNFILLVYNFTALSFIPFELFVVLAITFGAITLAFVGRLFRKKQQSTDFDLAFERSRQGAKVLRILLESQDGIPSKEMLDEIAYLRKIETGTI